jgi:GNAT superfamily N-acetyltransferase
MSVSGETHTIASSVPDGHRTFRLALQRLAEIAKEEGLRTLWFRILGELGYRRVLLLNRSLLEPIPDATPRLPVAISLLERTEITEYLEFRAGTSAGQIERRLDAGHCCFAGRYHGHLVATSWAATAQAWMHYLVCEVQLAPGEVYIYDSFTRPDCRGRGVSPAIGIEMLHHFRAAGYQRAVRAISPENRANLHAVAKTGYRPHCIMGYVKVGPWRRDFYRTHRQEGHT